MTESLVVQATVHRIVSALCNVLLESAEKTSPSIKICIKNDSKPGKGTKESWFRKECKDSRRSYRKAKRYYCKLKTNEAKVRYNLASKQYNKTVDRHRTLFNRDLTKKLRNLRTKDPKAFWNILSNKRGQEKQNLSLEVFANFFKKLNLDTNNTGIKVHILTLYFFLNLNNLHGI